MRFAGNDQNGADAIFLQATTYVAGFIESGLGANANFGEKVSRSSSDKALGKGNFCAAKGGDGVVNVEQYKMADAGAE